MIRRIFALLLLSTSLVGCASQTLNAPCPNFGKGCAQRPINGWSA